MGIMAPDDTGAWKVEMIFIWMQKKKRQFAISPSERFSVNHKYDDGDDEISDSDDAEDNRDLVSLC